MKVVQPSFELLDHNNLLRVIELGGRVCYKSEGQMGEGSDERLIEKLKSLKHESVFEHGVITVKFVTDRGVTHELVRHRIAAFSQESTRYCNYGKDKFGNEISVIEPFFFTAGSEKYKIWYDVCSGAEKGYLWLLEEGATAQEARSVLPNSLKTEIQVTANVREWRHILRLRAGRDAHPQIRQIMVPLHWRLARSWPVLFADLERQDHICPAQDITAPEFFDTCEKSDCLAAL
jgi:thymidylate synthase (FAD)